MNTATFDTHRFVGKLKAAGLDERQAEAMVDAFRELSDGAELVTKRDLALSTAEYRKDLAEMKYDLLKWVIGLALGQFALLVGILVKLS